MAEQWMKWEPLESVSQNYYAVSITDDYDGFKILLSNDNNTIDNKMTKNFIIILKQVMNVYRITQKSLRSQTIKMLNENYGSDFYATWPFFKITNSQYMQWLAYESSEISSTRNFSHFVVIASNLILDIVTPSEPYAALITQLDLEKKPITVFKSLHKK